MDPPEASSQSADVRAARRSANAFVSGCIVDMAGLPVLLRATTPSEGDALAALLGWLPSHDGPAQLEIVVEPEPPITPTGTPQERYGDVTVWRDGPKLAVGHPSGAVARMDGRMAVVGGGGSELRRAFRQLFPFVATHLLAGHDRFVVHAGVVATDGAALGVLGVTGAGKSTLVLAALLSAGGWTALGDDLAVVRAAPAGVEITAIRRPFSFPADVGATMADASPLPGDPRERWELPADSAEGWLALGGLVRVAHASGTAGHLRPWAPTAVLRTMVGAFASAPDPAPLRRWLPLAGAMSRLPAWELLHGTDPSTRLAEAGRSLDAVRAHLRAGR